MPAFRQPQSTKNYLRVQSTNYEPDLCGPAHACATANSITHSLALLLSSSFIFSITSAFSLSYEKKDGQAAPSRLGVKDGQRRCARPKRKKKRRKPRFLLRELVCSLTNRSESAKTSATPMRVGALSFSFVFAFFSFFFCFLPLRP